MESAPRSEPVPAVLNIAIGALAMSGCLWTLWLASHSQSWLVIAASAILFSYLNNTIFALFHEAEHKILHPNEAFNEWYGRLLGFFFPTSLAFHRCGHLNHHAFNRSEFETFDYIRPGDNLFLKYLQWYLVLTGLYWLLPPLACALYFVWPGFVKAKSLREGREAVQTATITYAKSYERADTAVIRMEIAGAVLFQLVIWFALDLNALGWWACYAVFALNWCSLQYADHAFSDCDTVSGAWNLRVHPVVRAFFLNYHYHRAHHEHPKVPWLYLGRYLREDEFRPWFGHIYAMMWRGPRPYPPDGRSPLIPESARVS